MSTSVAPPALSTVAVSIASEKVKVKVSVAEISVEPSTSIQAIELRVGPTLSVIRGRTIVASALPASSSTAAVGLTVAPLATVGAVPKVTTNVELSLQLIPEAPDAP